MTRGCDPGAGVLTQEVCKKTQGRENGEVREGHRVNLEWRSHMQVQGSRSQERGRGMDSLAELPERAGPVALLALDF